MPYVREEQCILVNKAKHCFLNDGYKHCLLKRGKKQEANKIQESGHTVRNCCEEYKVESNKE